MAFNLRKRRPLSYFEPEEPNFDEYIYCERCADFVYDYCAIHGPLLVVPDDKVPVNTETTFPVPRAALTIPHVFLHLAPSIIPGAGLGVFSTLTLPRDVRFGPYCGIRTQDVDSMYCWQIYDGQNRRSHVVDGADSDRSNWMRYVNCARHWKEQNLVAYQYRGRLYYRTIKIIPRYTELMVFYGSEFANALHVNLSKYNSEKHYKDIICAPAKRLRHNEDVLLKDYLDADQFHFIDENVEENSNSKNLTNSDENSSNTSTQINDNTPCSDTQDCEEIASKTRVKCEKCLKTFSKIRNLQEHIKGLHTNVWKYNCEYCLYKSNRIYSYKQHVGKHTNTFKFFCEKCPFKTNYGRNFKRHGLQHDKEINALKETNALKRETNALKKYSPLSMFAEPKKCELCDFKTCSKKAFGTHMSKHKGDIYKCDKCSYCNHSKYNLSRHTARSGH